MDYTALKLFLNKYRFIFFFFFLFFISRMFFINPQGVFFDSQEYNHLFSLSNYAEAIGIGHFPPHEGYIFLFWPIFHLATSIHLDGSFIVIVAQIMISFLTLLCFYQVILYLTDKKTALYATVLASLTPLFWIINVTLMMENAYSFFFFVSLCILTRYLKNSKKEILLHVSLLLFTFAVLTLTMVILWAPLYLFIIFVTRKKLIKKVFILMIVYVAIFSVANIFFLSPIQHFPPFQIAYFLYLSKRPEFAILHFDIHSLLVLSRNFIIPLLRNNSILIVLLASLSLMITFKKDKKIFLIGLLFIFPAVYTNQWWDSLLNGRHALITGFGLSFMTAYLIKRTPLVFYLLIIYLLIVSIPALTLLKRPIPYLQEEQYVKSLPKNALFIESHFARPQVQDAVKSKTIYINEPGWSKEVLKKEVNTYLANNKPVLISSAAISEPYGLYSGPYLHNITLSYENPFELESVLTMYMLIPYKTINSEDNLYVYKIISTKKSPYPSVKKLKNSYRRIDYTDPLWQMTWWFETTFLH